MKLLYQVKYNSPAQSPPARGAWIEMPTPYTGVSMAEVAPRTGGVD